MVDRFASGFNPFVLPFLFGMVFVITYCIIGAVRLFLQLDSQDRKEFLASLINPKILWKDIKDLFLNCLIHVKLWKRNKVLGYMHSSIAFGWFMLIVLGHVECFIYMPHRVRLFYYPIFFNFFVAENESTIGGAVLFFLMDFFLLMVLSGITLAIIKRVKSTIFGMRRTTKPAFLDRVGLYALWSIFPLRLLAEGFTADISGGSFLTIPLNWVLKAFLGNHMNMLPTWWAYSIALCIFMCVLPFTRYMHIPTEMLLIPFRNAGLTVKNARKGFAKAQVYSCPGCGVCIDACPMSVKKANIKDTTVYLNRQIRRGNEKRIEEISDKCMLCGKCSAVCQVQVDGPKMRIAQRSMRKYGYDQNYSNIDISAAKAECAKDVGIGKVIYFAGCMTQLTPAISRAMESIFKKAGVNYVFMDKDGGLCCGRPMLTAGRLKEAEQLIRKNREIIKDSGAEVLVLSCPICYKVFKEHYKLEGIQVMHHTEFIQSLINNGWLEMDGDATKYVFHDPCELGRGSGIYEQPREILRSAGTLLEANENRELSICCGGSLGSLSLGYAQRADITKNSLKNLTVDNPDRIVTACPLCKNTFSHYSDRPVEDIAETVDRNTR